MFRTYSTYRLQSTEETRDKWATCVVLLNNFTPPDDDIYDDESSDRNFPHCATDEPSLIWGWNFWKGAKLASLFDKCTVDWKSVLFGRRVISLTLKSNTRNFDLDFLLEVEFIRLLLKTRTLIFLSSRALDCSKLTLTFLRHYRPESTVSNTHTVLEYFFCLPTSSIITAFVFRSSAYCQF
jgi:hypothetical protein